MATVEDILDYLGKEVAPVKVSDEFCEKFKMYDNSGIILNCGRQVTGILFSLDLSEKAVCKAEECGYNLIVTHHPAIYGGVSRFDLQKCAQSRALAACLARNISVISMHLNFDAALNGIDYYLMKGLGGDNAVTLAGVEGGAYGRAYNVKPAPIEEYVNAVKAEFGTQRVIVHGGEGFTVKKVASFCGAGLDDEAVAFCKKSGVNLAVSSDLSHHRIAELVESGICVMQLTHYCAESYGFSKIYERIKGGLKMPSAFFLDGRFV